MMDWMNVLIQAGGAIAVCGMFLWFLLKKQNADDAARAEFLKHLTQKDAAANDVAREGYASLKELAQEFRELRGAIHMECKRKP